MKIAGTTLIALLISISSFAQQGINYKAIIKDGSGNLIVSQEIDVKFSIIEDIGTTVVYTEDHDNIMTDANGMIILNIGEGNTTDDFSAIDWGSETHSLKTEIDLDNDTIYEDLGTTAFKAVPYALTAADNPWKETGNIIISEPGDRVLINSENIGVPLALVTSSNSGYISFANTNGYRGYSGIFNGVNDMDFGTGGGNATGKVHLVTNSSPKLTVAANGNVGIGTLNPSSKLHVLGNARITNQLSVDLINSGGASLYGLFDNGFRLRAGGDFEPSYDTGHSLGSSDIRWLSVYALIGTINTSDRRDKTNIASLNYGLKEIMQLKPVRYQWKTMPEQGNKLGLIAQDLLNVIPEVVHTHDWVNESKESTQKKRVEAERMGVFYSDLIPVLIKAIQEQQETIESLKTRIDTLENR